MAGIYTTLNTQFKPISLQEMMIPLEYLSKKHEALDDELTKTEVLTHTALARLDPSSEAYKTKLNFLERLNTQRDRLLNEGYSNSLKHAMNALKSEYSETIIPIEKAIEDYTKAVNYRNEIEAKTPYAVWDKSGDNITVDQLIKTPGMVPKYVDTERVASGISSMLQHLTKQYIESGGGFTSTIDSLPIDDATKQTLRDLYVSYEERKHRGMSASSFQDLSDMEKNTFYNIAKQIEYASQGITPDRFSDAAMRTIDTGALKGLYSAIGAEEDKPVQFTIGKLGGKGSDTTSSPVSTTTTRFISDNEISSDSSNKLNDVAKSIANNRKYDFRQGVNSIGEPNTTLGDLMDKISEVTGHDPTSLFSNIDVKVFTNEGLFKNFNQMAVDKGTGDQADIAKSLYHSALTFKKMGANVQGVDEKDDIDNMSDEEAIALAKNIRVNESQKSLLLMFSEEAKKFNPNAVKHLDFQINGTELQSKLYNSLLIPGDNSKMEVKEFLGYDYLGNPIEGEKVKIDIDPNKDYAQISYPINANNSGGSEKLVLKLNNKLYSIPASIMSDDEEYLSGAKYGMKEVEKEYRDYVKGLISKDMEMMDGTTSSIKKLIEDKARRMASYTREGIKDANGKKLLMTDIPYMRKLIEIETEKVIRTGVFRDGNRVLDLKKYDPEAFTLLDKAMSDFKEGMSSYIVSKYNQKIMPYKHDPN